MATHSFCPDVARIVRLADRHTVTNSRHAELCRSFKALESKPGELHKDLVNLLDQVLPPRSRQVPPRHEITCSALILNDNVYGRQPYGLVRLLLHLSARSTSYPIRVQVRLPGDDKFPVSFQTFASRQTQGNLVTPLGTFKTIMDMGGNLVPIFDMQMFEYFCWKFSSIILEQRGLSPTWSSEMLQNYLNSLSQHINIFLPLKAEDKKHAETWPDWNPQFTIRYLNILQWMWLDPDELVNDKQINAIYILIRRFHEFLGSYMLQAVTSDDDSNISIYDNLRRELIYSELIPSNYFGNSMMMGSRLFDFLYQNLDRLKGNIADGYAILRLWIVWIRPWKARNKKSKGPERHYKKFVKKNVDFYLVLLRVFVRQRFDFHGHVDYNKYNAAIRCIRDILEVYQNETLLSWLKEGDEALSNGHVRDWATFAPQQVPLFTSDDFWDDLRGLYSAINALQMRIKESTTTRTSRRDFIGKVQDILVGGPEVAAVPKSSWTPAKWNDELQLCLDYISNIFDFFDRKELFTHDNHIAAKHVSAGSRRDQTSSNRQRMSQLKNLWSYPLKSYESIVVYRTMYKLSSGINNALEPRDWEVDNMDEAIAHLQKRQKLSMKASDQDSADVKHSFALCKDTLDIVIAVDSSWPQGGNIVADFTDRDSPSQNNILVADKLEYSNTLGYTLDRTIYFKDYYELVRFYSTVPFCGDSVSHDGRNHFLELPPAKGALGYMIPINLRPVANYRLLWLLVIILPAVLFLASFVPVSIVMFVVSLLLFFAKFWEFLNQD